MAYTKEIPPYGDVMTVEDFKKAVEDGGFIDYDGFGYPAKLLVDDTSTSHILPSMVDEIPVDASHIVWFNR